jgi:hypothetical protein
VAPGSRVASATLNPIPLCNQDLYITKITKSNRH